jgi:hypothetical protein
VEADREARHREARLATRDEVDLYDESIQRGPVQLVVKAIEDCESLYHNAWVERVERRYAAYRALSEQAPDPVEEDEDWHSNITTPYVLHTCEGMLATMLEPKPRFDVKPRPMPEEMLDLVTAREKVSSLLGETLSYAFERDHFPEKQRPFMQQDLIAGMSVFKDYWKTERRNVTQLTRDVLTVYDAEGAALDNIESYDETEQENVLVKDDACAEVWDVRDFFWPATAPDVARAEYLACRSWETFASLKRKEEDGYYQNVDKLKESRDVAVMKKVSEREQALRGVDRTKNMIEVIEYWTPERKICIGNRTVLLDDRPNPFWNGRLPFIVCSSMPDAFQIPGISVVEALAQMQEMLWTLQNQRLDVLRLLANLITVIRSDVDDPDSFEWAPNAQVETLKIDPTAAQITLQAEALLKGDLQNIMGGLPYASGAETSTLDQQTATGVSIITSIAQRIIQARKQHYLWAYAKLGKHFLQLYQQFLRDDRIVQIAGEAGQATWQSITPLDIQGDFDVLIDVTSDSLLRQERRAEAQSLLQVLASTAQIAAVSGAPINLKAPISAVLDAYDVSDKASYFLPAAASSGVAQPPGVPGTTAPPGGPTPGLTNVEAAAGPQSPSNVNSLSPEAAMQRLMAQRGTPPGG